MRHHRSFGMCASVRLALTVICALAIILPFASVAALESTFERGIGTNLRPLGKVVSDFGNLPQTWNQQGLHKGIDLLAPAGTLVYSVSSGVPISTACDDPWYCTIHVRTAEGVNFTFTHLDPNSIPAAVQKAIEERRIIAAGTVIGALSGESSGSRSHIHFSIEDCSTRRHLNPMLFMQYDDSAAPKIHGIFLKPLSTPLLKKADALRTEISGKVEILAEVSDAIDGKSGFYPPHRTEVDVKYLNGETDPVKEVVFDSSAWPFEEENSKCEEASSEFVLYGDILYYWAFDPDEFPISSGTASNHIGNWLLRLTDSEWNQKDKRPPGIMPHLNGWNTGQCDEKGVRIYPNGD